LAPSDEGAVSVADWGRECSSIWFSPSDFTIGEATSLGRREAFSRDWNIVGEEKKELTGILP